MALPKLVPQHKAVKCFYVLCRKRTARSCSQCGRPVCGQHSKQLADDGKRICGSCCMGNR